MTSTPAVLADRYELEDAIGQGNFSTTYRAWDRVLQRRVAVKLLRTGASDEDGFSPRFEREALAAARIDHHNVVQVYDFGHDGKHTFIVMQLVDGMTLRQFMRTRSPSRLPDARRIVGQILDGLEAVHDCGIVHRDIKPPNIMLSHDLDVKVGDFGVAHLTPAPSLTQTGTTLGTAAYMAPEQATGSDVSPQTDIYAVGVILYELVTGRLPFLGENPVQVMYQHVHNEPTPPIQFNPEIDRNLEAITLRSLAKDPADRFASASAMRAALLGEPVNEQESVPARETAASVDVSKSTSPTVSVRTTESRRPPWLLAGLLAILSIAVMVTTVVSVANVIDRARGDDTPENAGPVESGIEVGRFLSENPSETALDPGLVPSVVFEGPKLGFGAVALVAGGASESDENATDRPAAELYAQSADSSSSTLLFEADDEAEAYLILIVTGMDDTQDGRVPVRIALNEGIIHEGPSPFVDGRWTSTAWIIGDLTWLVAGENSLTIENLAADGSAGEATWVRLSEVTLYYQ